MSSCLDAAHPVTTLEGTPHFRPALHFTARDTWLNDPNGMVFHNGLYHLFFQNNPFGNVWGNMSWGHATSTDLVHWTEHDVAIPCDETEDIFSGSIVVDHGNTSGLGTDESPALVAVYTSAYKAGSDYESLQAQSLAYSTDDGMTWQKFSANPVLSRNSANFRDPKVFRYSGPAGTYWVMTAVEAQQQKVVLYRSGNLISWEPLSEFGPANADGGEWECPDLFPLPVDGDPENIKWVLIVNVNPGAVAGGSGGQYFLGHFDGTTFTPDQDSLVAPAGLSAISDPAAVTAALQRCNWLDWGRDCYAAVSFSDVPDGKRIIVGWMNNWDYANELPTGPWRSSMTLAREIRLINDHGRVRLTQQPVLPRTASAPEGTHHGTTPGRTPFRLGTSGFPLESARSAGGAYAIEARIAPEGAEQLVFTLRGSQDGHRGTYVTYDTQSSRLGIDRRASGSSAFHPKFASIESAPVTLENGILDLLIVVDRCSVEVFAQDGKVVLTDLIFPQPDDLETRVTAAEGEATVLRLSLSPLV